MMVLVRWLGAEQFGRFNYAASVVGLFAILFELGISTVAVREAARARDDRAIILEYGALKLIFSGLGMVLLAMWALFGNVSERDRVLVLTIGFYTWLVDLGSYVLVVYRARQLFWKETLIRGISSVLQLGACVFSLWVWHDVEHVAVALAFCAVVMLIPLAIEIRWGSGLARIPWRRLWEQLKVCLPLTGTAVVTAIYINFDIVILGRHGSMQEVGWYSVAVKTVFGLLIMPIHFFSLASLPALAAQSPAKTPSEISAYWLNNFARTTLVGASLSLFVGLFAEPLLRLGFGVDFVPAAPVLLAFVLTCLFFYLYTPLAQWALLHHRQKWSMIVSMAAALLNVALVLWLVPRLGMWGATIAAIATHGVLVVGHLRIVLYRSVFTGREIKWKYIERTVLATGVAWFVLRFFPAAPWVRSSAAAVIFIIATAQQWREWRGPLGRILLKFRSPV